MMNNFSDIVKRKQEEVQKLYNSDFVYKTLVDNYLNAKSDEQITTCINALHFYTDKLRDECALEFIKSLNITNEDIRDMLVDNIIDTKTMLAILKFKELYKESKNES